MISEEIYNTKLKYELEKIRSDYFKTVRRGEQEIPYCFGRYNIYDRNSSDCAKCPGTRPTRESNGLPACEACGQKAIQYMLDLGGTHKPLSKPLIECARRFYIKQRDFREANDPAIRAKNEAVRLENEAKEREREEAKEKHRKAMRAKYVPVARSIPLPMSPAEIDHREQLLVVSLKAPETAQLRQLRGREAEIMDWLRAREAARALGNDSRAMVAKQFYVLTDIEVSRDAGKRTLETIAKLEKPGNIWG